MSFARAACIAWAVWPQPDFFFLRGMWLCMRVWHGVHRRQGMRHHGSNPLLTLSCHHLRVNVGGGKQGDFTSSWRITARMGVSHWQWLEVHSHSACNWQGQWHELKRSAATDLYPPPLPLLQTGCLAMHTCTHVVQLYARMQRDAVPGRAFVRHPPDGLASAPQPHVQRPVHAMTGSHNGVRKRAARVERAGTARRHAGSCEHATLGRALRGRLPCMQWPAQAAALGPGCRAACAA